MYRATCVRLEMDLFRQPGNLSELVYRLILIEVRRRVRCLGKQQYLADTFGCTCLYYYRRPRRLRPVEVTLRIRFRASTLLNMIVLNQP